MGDDWDLVSKLRAEELNAEKKPEVTEAELRFSLKTFCPLDGKYWKKTKVLSPYLSAEAEWRAFAYVQRILLETRVDFGKAEKRHLDELDVAIEKFDPLNAALLEDDKRLMHDQLAVLEELGRHMSAETKALLHPGTTSYDVVDTARAYLFKKAWKEIIRPAVVNSIEKLCSLAENSSGFLQVGRTHLQNTSPVPLTTTLAGYAARLAKEVNYCDKAFEALRGKVSGINGTGASIDMVVGEGKSLEFEKAVLAKLGLEPDYTATQIVQKEQLVHLGDSLITMMLVLGDFSNDIRMLYSSAIGEVTSRDNKERLGGSSADAMKNNPIQYENIGGNVSVVLSGMMVLYSAVASDFQRDLRNSVMLRYQPQMMMVGCYESFDRLNKALVNLSVNEDKMSANLQKIRDNPSEAMVAILRGKGWVHSKYGGGHDFVKKMGQKVQKDGGKLIDFAMEDEEFRAVYERLSENKQKILHGQLELYIGSALERADINIKYAREVALK